MNIGIDGNEANIKDRVGSGQYSFHILKELHKHNKKHQITVFLKDSPMPGMPKENKKWQYKIIGPKPLWTKFALPLTLAVSKNNFDMFYSPTHYSPTPCPIATMPTIHDIGYLKTPKEFNKKDFYQLKNWTEQSIKQAKHIIAVSEYTKQEIIKKYKTKSEKITVIPNGITKYKKHTKAECQKVLNKFNIDKPFFLSIGTLKPNKNYPFLIKAFAKISGYQLVISGKKGWQYQEIQETIDSLSLQQSVILTDYISDKEKNILYQCATATVLPSLYEGFGIPAIEAQSFGCPVIVSDIPAYHEVMGHSAVFINPTNQKSLVTALKKVKKNNSNNYKRYLWHNSAKKLLRLFDSLSNV